MVNQMSEQMDIPKSEAKGLMNKAKQMNDVGMAEGGLNEGQRALRKEVMGMADGGAALRAFRYNDNGGKGTF